MNVKPGIGQTLNVDVDKDTKTSEILLDWADSCSLAPFIPDSSISLRANSFRTIDYALSNDIPITIQIFEGMTTSDHKSILRILTEKISIEWSLLCLYTLYFLIGNHFGI